MKTPRLVTIIVFVLLAAGLIAIRMYRVHEKESAPLIESEATAVRVAPVTKGKVETTHHFLGDVLGRTEVTLAPRITGHVLEVKVREGDSVRRGQTLVRLDAREIEDALAQAEARVASARVTMEAAEIALSTRQDATARDKVLYEAEAISQEQWDHSHTLDAAAKAGLAGARAQLTAAQKALDSTRTQLEYARVASPLDGRVSARLVDPGDLATPGRPLLRVVPDEAVRIRCRAPAEDIGVLKAGGKVRLTLDGIILPARISRVFPAMGREHLTTFEIDLDNPPQGLVSGATVGVDVVVASVSGLTVPADSLLEGERGAFVFTAEGGKAHLIEVEPLARSEQRVAVSGQITSGDQVIVARPSRLMLLAEGSPVRVAKKGETHL